ncbi:GIY-YIG nuclease family protein [Candidatus Synechococcus calcipolaris G9]|uniref:GIY-YIG nuclease family protein n=1 Tax=Candidatus Synechococcus calcipolaris G9 TaxID=1497997 RepID=A0ABT6F2U1_9SYNE|nr:GIY-YIG nuclease family protein [Candidatus Synechococcus calcipolaris]MDG2992184.1 GIY-YIG nuclease family protein [Candidatus Synechococcus calcipolaris G9]
MTPALKLLPLSDLDFLPFLDAEGYVQPALMGKVGAYAIFNQDQKLEYIGYSRDVHLSLKQHLVRRPDHCYWIKSQCIERPDRTLLEQIRQHWITEAGMPAGNEGDRSLWEQAIDIRPFLSQDEQEAYNNLDELAQQKFLKQAARRREAEIFDHLARRSVQEPLRFNPKLKDSGLLDLKT